MSSNKLAYLGPRGTFSEEAAMMYGGSSELVSFSTIDAVGEAVRSRIAGEGVVPIENSLEGSVNDTLDLLISQKELYIRWELILPIEHCLLAKPEVKNGEIVVIYSHPQALAQSGKYIEKEFPNAQKMASLSTAAAVEDMKSSSHISAAIAPKRAGEIYNVKILSEGIQDNANNVTRFVVLSNIDNNRTGDDKTSLCFSFDEDKAGTLHEALGELASRGINMGKIESRPTKKTLGRYIFLVDIDGHREDAIVKDALSRIRPKVSDLRIFGSYPRWTESS